MPLIVGSTWEMPMQLHVTVGAEGPDLTSAAPAPRSTAARTAFSAIREWKLEPPSAEPASVTLSYRLAAREPSCWPENADVRMQLPGQIEVTTPGGRNCINYSQLVTMERAAGRLPGVIRCDCASAGVLPGAYVSLFPDPPDSSDLSRLVLADQDGRFEFDDVPDGRYVLETRMSGYLTREFPVILNNRDDAPPLELTLDSVCFHRFGGRAC